MIINSYRYAGGAAPAFDADYQAVLTYAQGKGWSLPSAGQQTLGNALVLALKAAGVWNKLYWFYPAETDGDVDFACINWKDPQDSTNLVRVNSPIYAANSGFKGDGVSAYLEIPYNPTTLGWNENDFAIGAMDLDNVAQGNSMIISSDNAEFFMNPCNPVLTKSVRNASGTATTISTGVTDSRGFHLMDRSNSANFNFALDGVSLGNFSRTSTAFSNTVFYSLLLFTSYSTRRVSMIFGSQSIWVNQAAFYSAINTYRTGL